MRSLLIGVSLLALAAPVARAQQADDPVATVSGQAEPSSFVVYFGFNKANLDASARQVIAMAVDEYKRTGAAQISVTGYADKAGQAEHNQRLSERRAEAVRRELERLGGPASAIQVGARGGNEPPRPPGGRGGGARPRRPAPGRRARGPEPPGRDRDAAGDPPAGTGRGRGRDAPAARRGRAGRGARGGAAQALRVQPRPDLRAQLPGAGPRDQGRLRRRGDHAQRPAGPRRVGAQAGHPLRLQHVGRRGGGALGPEPSLPTPPAPPPAPPHR